MNAYRTYLTIEDPSRVVLSDVPFAAGQRVEVLVVDASNNQADTVETLRELFNATQALPQARIISEDEIAAEIDAYRSQS